MAATQIQRILGYLVVVDLHRRYSVNQSMTKYNSKVDNRSYHLMSTVNVTKFKPVEGVFGDSLKIFGSNQQFFTVLNKNEINPHVFSVSFWIKQDPGNFVNSSVISHINSSKSAGWYFQSNTNNLNSSIQFSVANSDGKIFSASAPLDTEVFQNIVGVFDGNVVKIYNNGLLVDKVAFSGNYNADPGVPLNIGLNSYDYRHFWNGAIDEVRLYDKVISEDEIQGLADYGKYLQSSSSPKKRALSGIGHLTMDYSWTNQKITTMEK